MVSTDTFFLSTKGFRKTLNVLASNRTLHSKNVKISECGFGKKKRTVHNFTKSLICFMFRKEHKYEQKQTEDDFAHNSLAVCEHHRL